MPDLVLPRIINAAGHMSALGGAVTPPELAARIARAIEDALTRPVDMQWLRDEASRRIASATGAEAGCVTTGAAAGMALAVAACVAGSDLAIVRELPAPSRRPRVALQAGHDIDFGAPVTQMIRLGGAEPVVVGSPEVVTAEQLSAAMVDAAAVLFVQSHHAQAPNRLSLAACIEIAAGLGVPVIVDAAAEEDLHAYVALGASLVAYSGGKALGGLSSSGLLAGRHYLIEAVRAQERGIGRAMKVGPEQILSVCIALDFYGAAHHDDEAVLAALLRGVAGIPGIACSVVPDEAGRPIRRLEVRTPHAREVVRALREGHPPVFVRAHKAAEGRFAIDPRNLSLTEVPVVLEALKAALAATRE